MTDARLADDRVPEAFDDGSARSAIAHTAAPRAAGVSREAKNPWLRGLFWMWLTSAIAAFISLVASSTAGNSNTAYYPTWDLSSAGQTVLVLLAFFLGFVAFVSFVGWLVVRATQWRAPGALDADGLNTRS